MLNILVTETNRYAEQFIAAEIPDDGWSPKARVRSWRPVTDIQMQQFLGLNILTGLIKKPEINLYWSTDDVMATPYFSVCTCFYPFK